MADNSLIPVVVACTASNQTAATAMTALATAVNAAIAAALVVTGFQQNSLSVDNITSTNDGAGTPTFTFATFVRYTKTSGAS